MLSQKRKKKNPDDKDRKRQIDEFMASKGIKRLDSGRSHLSIPLKEKINNSQYRCQLCDSWTDEDGELHHYDWCPTYKQSRKNPSKKVSRKNPVSISKTKSAKYDRDLIQLDLSKKPKYRDQIFLTYKGKEIEFTGEDAEDLRDIMREQLKVFRGSSRLQKLYPSNLDSSGGYDTFITEQLKKVYPKVFR